MSLAARWSPAAATSTERPVNLASRITGAARPGSVLVEDEVREEVPDGYRYSRAGRKHLKGIKGTVEVFRCRRLDEAEDE